MTTTVFRRSAALLLLASGAARLHAQDASETRTGVKPSIYAAADYSYQSFQDGTDAWQLASLSIGRRSDWGSVIGRVNWADRFASTGTQVEVDAYPRLSKNAYAYLNVGYSGSSIFPAWRSGGEVFVSLPSAWEASLGYRQLRFDGSPVTLLTGAVGKYVGNYWFSLRPYVRPKDNGTSASASLTARRYYEDSDNYWGARIGYGSTPPDQGTPDALSLNRLHAFSAAVQGSGNLNPALLGTWSVGYDSEELTASHTRQSWTAALGIKVKF